MKQLIARFGRERIIWGLSIGGMVVFFVLILGAAFGIAILEFLLIAVISLILAALFSWIIYFCLSEVIPKRKEKPDDEYDPYERIQNQVGGDGNIQVSPLDEKNHQRQVGGTNNKQVIK